MIAVTLLYKWCKEYEEFWEGSFPGNRNYRLTPEEEKTNELVKKLNEVEMERDILKKAISTFLVHRLLFKVFMNVEAFPRAVDEI